MKRDYGKMWQFQCQREGTLFYYQTGPGTVGRPTFIDRCPLCGSKRVKAVRAFPGINEHDNSRLVETATKGEPQ